MKNNKIYIGLLIIILIVVVCSIFFILREPKTNGITLSIMKNDIQINSIENDQVFTIKEGDTIKLYDNDNYVDCGKHANNIKILEINDDYVKISRDKIVKDEDSKEVIEKVEYDKEFDLYLYETDISEPHAVCSQARYNYYGVFTKQQ